MALTTSKIQGKISRYYVLFGAAALMISAAPAYAGFEWRPAAGTPSGQQDIVQMPVTGVIPVQPTPLINTPVEQQNLYAPVVGFGRDIPISMALQQILPGDFSYSLSDNVDPNLPVTWNGGKPWDQELSSAIAPHGLTISITGNNVLVRKGEALSTVSSAMPPLPPLPGDSQGGGYIPAHQSLNAGKVLNSVDDAGAFIPSVQNRGGVSTEEGIVLRAAMDPYAMPAEPVVMPGVSPSLPAQQTQPPQQQSYQNLSGAPVPQTPYVVIPAINRQPTWMDPIPNATRYASAPGRTVDMRVVSSWQASGGESLQAVLARWSAAAGVKLYWGADQAYRMAQPVSMNATYADAVRAALSPYQGNAVHPYGILHPNLPNGPSVLIVKSWPDAF